MDHKLFKLDIDELINEFAEGGSTTLAELKEIWLSKKFTYIFEASPTTNQGYFMQSLYAHSIGYLVSSSSLSHRLGGLYCLYCLYETQPFKPPFKIYISLGELKQLRNLAAAAKEKGIKVVSALVKRMLERNLFLYGCIDINQGSVTDRVNELTDIQNARVQLAYKKLFANTRIEHFIHMDMGTELDVDLIKKKSTDYAVAKDLAITEARELVDVENIKHIAESRRLFGDVVEKTADDWNVQKELFYQQTGFGYHPVEESSRKEANDSSKRKKLDDNYNQNEVTEIIKRQDNDKFEGQGNDDEFGKELEDVLLSLPFENDNEETELMQQPGNDHDEY